MNDTPLGDDLRDRREAMRLSQEELARRVGVSVRTYVRWEHGLNEPQPRHRRALLVALEERADD